MPDGGLPFHEVCAVDPATVAGVLGLKRAKRGRRKYGCPCCGSSDALHARNGKRPGFKCYAACGKWRDAVDMAVAVWGVDKMTACTRLADALGFGHLVPEWARRERTRTSAPVRERTPTAVKRHRQPAPDDALAGLRAAGVVPALAPQIYTAIVGEMLTLTPLAADYLRGRALDPEQARQYGFRSLDGPADWQRLAAQLRESFLDAELAAAGFPTIPWRGRLILWLPWDGIPPALVLPYPVGAEIVALRFRALADATPKHLRYLSLIGQPITRPWNSDVLRDCAGAELHCVEGELDGETLRQRGYRAIALGGATPADEVRDAIARRVAGVAQLIIWQDRDAAGAHSTEAVCARLQREHGLSWLRERVEVRRPVAAKDVNELAAGGLL